MMTTTYSNNDISFSATVLYLSKTLFFNTLLLMFLYKNARGYAHIEWQCSKTLNPKKEDAIDIFLDKLLPSLLTKVPDI